jgi:DNA end-binding protein Ku
VWKGTISFGLVSIPVRLVSATEERDVSFRQVRRSDGSRVRYRRVAEADGEEVPYSEIAKGYELPEGGMVVLTDDDLADLPVPSSKAVDVLQFVDAAEIDPAAYSRAYYAVPSGDAKPYVLLREALEKAGRVAVVKLALRSRERLAVLRPSGDALVVQTMLWPDEVRQADLPSEVLDVEPRDQELAMATSYIDAMTGEFTPEAYTDEYRAAVEELVASKVEGREIVMPPEAEGEPAEVVDLMEALRKSVEAAQERRAGAG